MVTTRYYYGGAGGRGASYGSGAASGAAGQNTTAGRGGNGGGFGSAGARGSDCSSPYLSGPISGAAGGAGGKCTVGNSRITWLKTGSRYGALT